MRIINRRLSIARESALRFALTPDDGVFRMDRNTRGNELGSSLPLLDVRDAIDSVLGSTSSATRARFGALGKTAILSLFVITINILIFLLKLYWVLL